MVNLMTLSVYKKLCIENVKLINMVLHLADQSIRHPYGILEGVLKDGNLKLPIDFIVLDMDYEGYMHASNS